VLLVFAIPYFYLVGTGNVVLATIASVIGFGFVFGFGYGAIPTSNLRRHSAAGS
jgi:hypothetical protein